jgi:hypothetical protein
MTEHDDDFLEQMCRRYEGGDKTALPYSLNYCITNNHPIPPWLAMAFREACHKVLMHEVKSWDEVLGRPLKKGKQLAVEQRNMKIAFPLWERVRERHKGGAAIDKGLFEEVGGEFEVGATVASELYYEMCRELEEMEAMMEASKTSGKI